MTKVNRYLSNDNFTRLRKDYEYFCRFFKLKGDSFKPMWTNITCDKLNEMLADYGTPPNPEAVRQMVFREIIKEPHILFSEFEEQLGRVKNFIVHTNHETMPRKMLVLSIYEKMVKHGKSVFELKAPTVA